MAKRKILLLLLSLLALALFLGFLRRSGSLAFLPRFLGGQTNQPAKLVYWGLFEPKEVVLPLIEDFQKQHPGVEIEYTQRSFSSLSQYKELLLTRLRQGTGPDILRLHLTWVPQFAPDLSPLPSKVLSKEEYAAAFFAVAQKEATVNDQLFAVPLQYDGLALFLNDNFVKEATPSAKLDTWPEFRDLAAKLAKTDASGKLVRGGAAIGLASNVAHAADIFSLMLAQSGLTFPDELDSQSAQDALTFYTNFVRQDHIWDNSFSDSIHAFARGEVAMIFAPAWRISDIKNLNPSLRFSLASVPQIPALEGNLKTNVHWATFWVEAVSAKAKNTRTAWEFLKFLSAKESLLKMSSLAAGSPFTPIYPRRDLAEDLSVDPLISPLVSGAPTATSFITTEMVGNDPYVEAIRSALEASAKGGSAAEALKVAKANIEQLLAASGQR